MTTLRPGVVEVSQGAGKSRACSCAAASPTSRRAGLTILAEQAIPVEELDAGRIDAEIRNAEEDVADARSRTRRAASPARSWRSLANSRPLSASDRGHVARRSGDDDLHLGHDRPPKGALHGHRVLLGHLPGIADAARVPAAARRPLWTPADWAWAGGLLNVCCRPAFRRAGRGAAFEKFDPEAGLRADGAAGGAQRLHAADGPAHAARGRSGPRRFDLKLRTIGSAARSLGAETFEWGRAELGLTINEFYGQTECNLVLGSCAAIGVKPRRRHRQAGAGHAVAVIRCRTARPARRTRRARSPFSGRTR
jgi:hypothetical protein